MKSPIISHIISAISRTVKNTPLLPVKNTGEKYGVREYWTGSLPDACRKAFVMDADIQGYIDSDGTMFFTVIKK